MDTCIRDWGGKTYEERVNEQRTTFDTLLHYNTKYRVLICKIHKYAVYHPEFHLKQEHYVTGKEADALVQEWLSLDLCTAKGSRVPPNGQEERSWLAPPVEGFSCRGTNCRYVTNEYSKLIVHWSTHHHLDLRDAPIPTFDTPKSYAKCARMQTLFPSPYEKWFTVVPPQKSIRMNQFAISLYTHHATQKQKKQRLGAAEHQSHNIRHSYMHRLPAEIRTQIYELALASDVTYHIEDMLTPVRHDGFCEEDDEDGQLDMNQDEYRPNYKLRCMIEKDIQGFYQNGRSHKLRAISLSSGYRNPVGLLQTCSLVYREASSVFYSRNRFFIHTRWHNWTSVNQFLDLLRPETRRYIRNLGVLRLRPMIHSNPKLYGRHPKQAALYYSSMKTFLEDFIPQLSLRSLLLHVDLADLYPEPNIDLSYSPQAPWLNLFLRLPLDAIDIRVGDDGYDGYNGYTDDGLHIPGNRLVDRLNAIDFRNRVRAKRLHNDNRDAIDSVGVPLWWKEVPAEERVRRRDAMKRYKREPGASSWLDIWAPCATLSNKEIMAEAIDPYDAKSRQIGVNVTN